MYIILCPHTHTLAYAHANKQFPYVPFLQIFEQMCIRDLRERVACGGDPTKLCQSPTKHVDPNVEQGMLAILL